MNRWSALAIVLAFAGALLFRLPRLDVRPLHNDEAVNAVKVAELWQHGEYRYDPDEYHGPTLHYATLPFLVLSGVRGPEELRDATLRLAPVFFGAGLILLLVLFADGIGRQAATWSALFIAVSPAMVFYSRYFIHEMLLVFFTALFLGSAWRYLRSRSTGWAISAGTALGLMFATKETFVLSLAAAVLALIATAGCDRSWRTLPRAVGAGLCWKDMLLAFAACFVVWILFFSSFFTNWAGLADSVLTYFPWLKRAAGHSPHLHPWYFYFQRLGWFHPVKGPVFSEALVLILAVIGGVVSFARGRSSLGRFLVFYTVVLAAIYSVITYKTPWCLLNFYIGILMLAGVGAAFLVQKARLRVLRVCVTGVILVLSAQLALQAKHASFDYASDRRNPYVYAQTVPDLLNLVKRAEGLAQVSPAGFETVVKVIVPEDDYWPLPWYLRRFKNVGWYSALPEDPFAPIIIASAELGARLDDKSERKWIMVGITELRPGKFLELYVELELWKKYVETLPPSED